MPLYRSGPPSRGFSRRLAVINHPIELLRTRPITPQTFQSRGAARPITSAHQTAQIALSARRRSGSGTRQVALYTL